MNLNFLLSNGQARNLREVSFPGKLRFLVLAPHPDDFDAIGETLKYLYNAGHDMQVAVAETGSGVEDTYRGGLTQQEKRECRKEEQIHSIRFFGLPDHCLQFLDLHNAPDDQLSEENVNLERLKERVLALKPDCLFLPHGNDTNRAHRAMYKLARQIAEQVHWPVALLLNQDVKTVSLKMDLYFPFNEEEAAWKAQLLRFHDSQQQRNLKTRGHGFDERVLNLNRAIASGLALDSLDSRYASAFEVQILD